MKMETVEKEGVVEKEKNKEKKESKNVILEKEEELVCPICNSKNIIKDYERAEIVCAD